MGFLQRGTSGVNCGEVPGADRLRLEGTRALAKNRKSKQWQVITNRPADRVF